MFYFSEITLIALLPLCLAAIVLSLVLNGIIAAVTNIRPSNQLAYLSFARKKPKPGYAHSQIYLQFQVKRWCNESMAGGTVSAWSDLGRLGRQLCLYEVHTKGFTQRHPEVPEELRGTYAGLASPAAIEHLRSGPAWEKYVPWRDPI